MKYFINTPYTAETLKNEYRELCKKLHPDTGGNEEAFKEMNAEYNSILQNVQPRTSSAASGYSAQDMANDWNEMQGAPLRGTKKLLPTWWRVWFTCLQTTS